MTLNKTLQTKVAARNINVNENILALSAPSALTKKNNPKKYDSKFYFSSKKVIVTGV